jgi:hypothetical protein
MDAKDFLRDVLNNYLKIVVGEQIRGLTSQCPSFGMEMALVDTLQIIQFHRIVRGHSTLFARLEAIINHYIKQIRLLKFVLVLSVS